MVDPASAFMDQIASDFESRLDKKLGSIKRSIDGLSADQDSMSKQVSFLLDKAGVRVAEHDAGEPIQQVDQTWQCVKCGARLGFYDEAEDVLRIRHKDLTVWAKIGAGGKLSVVCRSCSELNTVEWSQEDSNQAG